MISPVSGPSLFPPALTTPGKPVALPTQPGSTSTDTSRIKARERSETKPYPASESPGIQNITESEQQQVEALRAGDREVRAHEAAHKAVAGNLARGSATFSYQQGPDGRRYAVSGEVSIDTSPVAGDPQATLQKAQTIRAAALAPAQPSNQDRAVAAKATQMAAKTRAELASQSGDGPNRVIPPRQNPADEIAGVKGAETYRQAARQTSIAPGGALLNIVA